ncbi:hypothetical protein FRC02_009238 [Tulasnella sp. 418]|nr:hypothetical protein FRC02_009238 [Tulasnella sp. 418]
MICQICEGIADKPRYIDCRQIEFFPTPEAVAASSIPTLRTAGLSARKAEYILDLATRFADGRLSAHKLASAPAQEVYDMLIQVKGIGPWTIEMFSIFSLRRPDILPTGDLGVQKGLLRWMIAGHSPEDARNIRIMASRLPGNENEEQTQASSDAPSTPYRLTLGVENPDDVVASPSKEVDPISSILPAPKGNVKPPETPVKKRRNVVIPPPTPLVPPSESSSALTPSNVTPIPEGLTLATLKSRSSGKKVKKGLYLTPAEMEAITAPWAPYRSIGIWYLWSIVDNETD